MKTLRLAVIAAYCASTTSQMSNAQSTTPNLTEALEEITVTATKRTEKAQDVPITINTFSAEFLREAGVSGSQQLLELIPGFTPTVMQERGVAYFNVRGLGRPGGRPTVMYVVDGIEQTGFHGHLINTRELYDIERVEALKGPQPTLYGRDAVGGVVSLTHNPPIDATEFFGEIDGGDYERYGGMAGLNVPLSESVYLRGHAFYGHREGYNDGLVGRNIDGEKYHGAVLALRLAPNERLDATATIDYFETKTGLARYIRFLTPTDTDSRIRSEELGDDDMERLTSVLNLGYDFGPLRFDSATGYTRFDQFFTFDLDFSEHTFFERGQPRLGRTFSQELRLTSPDGNRFRWMTGLYYVRERFDDNIDQWIAPFGITTHLLTSAVTTQYSAFLNLEYDVTEKWAIAVGGRGAREKIESDASRGLSVGQNILGIPAGTAMTSDPVFADESERFLPRGTLTYEASDDLTLFASVAKGVTGAQFSAEGLSDAERGVKAETALNYEAGVKTSLLEGRLSVSAAAFYTEWERMQFFENIIIGTPRSVYANLGDSEIRGVELELQYQPRPSLDLGLNLVALETEVVSVTPNSSANPVRPIALGERIPHTPDLTVNAYASYTHELSTDSSFSLRLDWDYNSEHWNVHEAVPVSYSPSDYFAAACPFEAALGVYDCRHELPSISRLNVNLGFDYKNIETQLYVNNVFDKRIPDLFFTFPTTLLGLPETPSHPGILTPPRTMGIRMRFSF